MMIYLLEVSYLHICNIIQSNFGQGQADSRGTVDGQKENDARPDSSQCNAQFCVLSGLATHKALC